MVERNLDQEEAYEEARAAAGQGASNGAGGALKNPVGAGINPTVNPNLHVPDLPGWHEWAARTQADIDAGRIKMIRVGVDPPPPQHLRGVA